MLIYILAGLAYLIAYLSIGVSYAKRSAREEWERAINRTSKHCKSFEDCYSDRDHVHHLTIGNVIFWGSRWPMKAVAGWIDRTIDNADPTRIQRLLQEEERARKELDRKLQSDIDAAYREKDERIVLPYDYDDNHKYKKYRKSKG